MLIEPSVAGIGGWVAFFGSLAFILAFYLRILWRRPPGIDLGAALVFIGLWVGLGLVFSLILDLAYGKATALTYLRAYGIERVSSIKAVLTYFLIFTGMGTPPSSQNRVLFIAVASTLTARITLVLVGPTAVTLLQGFLLPFAGILVIASFPMLLRGSKVRLITKNPAYRLVDAFFPLLPHAPGNRFFCEVNGRLRGTALAAALFWVEASDIFLSIGAVPLVAEVSQDPFIAIAANLFGVLGTRSLYLLLAWYSQRIPYQASIAGIGGLGVAAGIGAGLLHFAAPLTISLVLAGLFLFAVIAAKAIARRKA